MLNVKLVKEVVEFVELQVKRGATIQIALNIINNREEARGGNLKSILDFINNDEATYLQLKSELHTELEIQAQEALL